MKSVRGALLLLCLFGCGGSVDITPVTSAFAQQSLNSVVINSMPSGQRPFLQAVGPDSTVYIDYYCKGDCLHVFRAHDGGVHTFVSGSLSPQAMNFFIAYSNVLGSGPQLRAIGPDTNIDINLIPQGNGRVKLAGPIGIPIVPMPSTEAGYGVMFIDEADGALKIKFVNGVVRTITYP